MDTINGYLVVTRGDSVVRERQVKSMVLPQQGSGTGSRYMGHPSGKLGWISNGASKSSKILKISLKLLIYHVYWWSKEGCIGGFYINWCCIKKSSCPFFLETSMYYKIVNITAPCKYLITVLIYVKHFIRIVLIDDKHICMP